MHRSQNRISVRFSLQFRQCMGPAACELAHLIYRSLQQLKQDNGNEDRLLIHKPKGFKEPRRSSCEGEEAHLCKDDHLRQHKVLGCVSQLPMSCMQPKGDCQYTIPKSNLQQDGSLRGSVSWSVSCARGNA